MFFDNEADRFLKRFFSDPFFGAGESSCADACCGPDNEEENSAMLQRPGVRYYGYVATMGPDGRPVIHEFGNAVPAGHAQLQDKNRLRAMDSEAREPLTDTIVDEKEKVVKLITEMPGVEKQDIKISVQGRHVSVSAESKSGRRYQMRLPLERRVHTNSAKATYHNGILQIVFSMAEGTQGGKTIRVD